MIQMIYMVYRIKWIYKRERGEYKSDNTKSKIENNVALFSIWRN